MEEFRESAPGISLVVLDSDRMDCTEVTVWDSCHVYSGIAICLHLLLCSMAANTQNCKQPLDGLD